MNLVISDPIVKEQGRMASLPGHTSPTPVTAAGQIGGLLFSFVKHYFASQLEMYKHSSL